MFQLLEQYFDPQFLAMLFAAIAAGATVLTLAMPLLAQDTLSTRMKAVAFEREKIRLRERERLAQGQQGCASAIAESVHEDRSSRTSISANGSVRKQARTMLVQAGYRGQAPYVTYLFFRMVMPVAMLLASLFYVFVVIQLDQPR